MVIVGTRRTGKTYAMVKLAEKEKLIILCRTIADRNEITRLAEKIGAKIKKPLLFSEINSISKEQMKNVCVDNGEAFIEDFLSTKGINLKHVSIGTFAGQINILQPQMLDINKPDIIKREYLCDWSETDETKNRKL